MIFSRNLFWHYWSHVVSCITTEVLYSILPSFGPLEFTDAGLGSLCSLSHRKLNIADLLLLQNIFHLPKYTGPAFLTLHSDLCIWSGNAVRRRRSRGAQHGWLKGKVMTLSTCVFGSCETTAGISP